MYTDFESWITDNAINLGFVGAAPPQDHRDLLYDWVKSTGIDEPVPSGDIHVTLMYSKPGIPFPWAVGRSVDPNRMQAELTGEFDLFGPDQDALVLKLNSPDLEKRHHDLKLAGARHSYSEYKPHLTLKYGATTDDLTRVKRKPLPLNTIELKEYPWEPIKEETEMKSFEQFLSEQEDNTKLVDDIVKALEDVKTTVYDGGENFNVAFTADGTEYYIRPNDKGEELFYIDADQDDYDSYKVKDIAALKKEVMKLMGKEKEE